MAAAVLRQHGAAVAQRSGAAISEAAPSVPSITAAAAPFVAVKFHLGTDLSLQMPSDRMPAGSAEATALPEPARKSWGFDGVPLQRWADWLGEKAMPALEAVQEDQAQAKRRFRTAAPQMVVPTVPHVLPVTRWAMHQDTFQKTLIADDSKNRKPARLSWYHPDDTMVPRGWFKGGLMADLAYYNPFGMAGKEAAQQG